ncbi:MAG: Uma2 family endonuclease [Planctomycetes bacterium]|nr:Uma2 family endonuclease [Planctomycetota bacterium]
MSIGKKLVTARELFEMGSDSRLELVRGELCEMNPTGWDHGEVSSVINIILGGFVRSQDLGKTVIAEVGFRIECDPDTVRAPDVAFVEKGRIPTGPQKSFFDGAPDLAVEVVSPSDRISRVMEKVEMWLQCGSRAVWLVDPARKSASIATLVDGHVESRDVDVLADAELLPGFELTLSELWD